MFVCVLVLVHTNRSMEPHTHEKGISHATATLPHDENTYTSRAHSPSTPRQYGTLRPSETTLSPQHRSIVPAAAQTNSAWEESFEKDGETL